MASSTSRLWRRRTAIDTSHEHRIERRRFGIIHGVRSPSDVDALFVSHEHGDHIRSAGVFHRTFNVPIYVTKPTLNVNGWDLGRLAAIHKTAFQPQ
ncbi:MAG: MBL fold metallo-hydrolase [Planctomycetes bacterium]|nr:MBL fold metallo-hydrolase [Planctomycetota bacterium]